MSLQLVGFYWRFLASSALVFLSGSLFVLLCLPFMLVYCCLACQVEAQDALRQPAPLSCYVRSLQANCRLELGS